MYVGYTDTDKIHSQRNVIWLRGLLLTNTASIQQINLRNNGAFKPFSLPYTVRRLWALLFAPRAQAVQERTCSFGNNTQTWFPVSQLMIGCKVFSGRGQLAVVVIQWAFENARM